MRKIITVFLTSIWFIVTSFISQIIVEDFFPSTYDADIPNNDEIEEIIYYDRSGYCEL
jgi:hypothetical protein